MSPAAGGVKRRRRLGDGGGEGPVAAWAREGEHGTALVEAEPLGSTGRPERERRWRRMLGKAATRGGEEAQMRRLWRQILEGV